MLRQAKEISLNLRRATQIQELSKAADEFLKSNQNEDELNATQFLALGLAHLEAGKSYKTNNYFDKALQKTTDPLLVAECYYGIMVKASSGVSLSNKSQESLNDRDQAFRYASKCLNECEKFATSNPSDYWRIKSNLLRNRGILYLKLEDYGSAIKDFHESVEIAEKFPELKGFLPAVVAYEALVEGKNANYPKAFFLFAKAEQLYLQFSQDELADSMDYASFFTHKTRIFLLLEWYESAMQTANIAYQMRHDYLVSERNKNGGIGNDYVTSRMAAIINLRDEAITKLDAKNILSINNQSHPITELSARAQSKDVLFQTVSDVPAATNNSAKNNANVETEQLAKTKALNK